MTDATLVIATLDAQTIGQPKPTSPDPTGRTQPGGATAAGSQEAAVASPRGSKSFAPLDAIVSLRSCSRGQARSGQDWRGARNIGRWRGTSIVVRSVLTAALGRRPADGLVRSSPGFCY